MDDVFRYQVLFTVSEQNQVTESEGAAETIESEVLIERIIKVHRLKKVSQWPLKALGLEAVVAEFSSDREIESVIATLQADTRIESVQSVNTYELLSYNDPYFHLQKSSSAANLESVHKTVTGKQISVAIVDTGIDRDHPELAGRVLFSENFVSHDQLSFDRDEHGTTVAGVIGSAANNNLGVVGVAPDVNLMAFKACAESDLSRRASCDSFSLMKALAEVLRQKPDILNLSLAGAQDPLLSRLIEAALQKGIIVIAAVDHSSPENTFPASIPGVIAVSSAFQFTHDWMPKGGVLAPGSEVLTTTPGATYAFRSGSSMSTAFVSGVAALMKEKDPTLSSTQFNNLLHKTAQSRINAIPLVDVCHLFYGTGNVGRGEVSDSEVCNQSSILAVESRPDSSVLHP